MRDEEAARQSAERMAMMLVDWGFPRMPARVLMAAMTADEELLTAADIGERLGVSPAAVSGAVRYLIQLRMLIREPLPGSRRDVYRLPPDAWYEITALKGALFKVLAGMSDETVQALGEQTAGGRRMATMRDYFLFVEGEMPKLLERWRKHKADNGLD
ncbi:MarR family transcriptional regulator [Acrocarpospora macrocephala]|uniref:Transcriptional regulator n=2 Tax=Acrocarpospora TaxID=90974 RepID=A0A5M3XLY8_9ACTN|nr:MULTISPECIES: helix-turn-helix domain-containing protein [Acrocarpospora]GES15211.1 transcriptional regulator [Acrocarpospora macrocephala]GES21892.1 transcriptional regulator [Acrocarpospora pleiomorpha]